MDKVLHHNNVAVLRSCTERRWAGRRCLVHVCPIMFYHATHFLQIPLRARKGKRFAEATCMAK